MTLIVDAAPIVALGDTDDARRRAVGDALRRESGRLVVPGPVTAEIDFLLYKHGGRAASSGFLSDLATGRFEMACLTPEECEVAVRVDGQYAGLHLGLADLSIVLLAHRFRTTRLLTFDERDFRTMTPLGGGHFTLLPMDEAP